MQTSNRYASFLLRLWQQRVTNDQVADSWQGEIEHIQSGEVFHLNQLAELPGLVDHIATLDRSQNSEVNENE